MIRRKKDVDGDLWIPGSITVLGGINTTAYRKTVTKVATTEDRVTVAEGDITVIEDVVAGLASDTLALSKTLSLSVSGITRSRTDALSPSGVTMAVVEQDGSPYPCRFTVELSHDGITYQTPVYTSGSDVSSYTYTTSSAKMSVSGTDYYIAMIRVRYYVAGGTTTLLGEGLCRVSPDPSNAAAYLGIGILEGSSVMTFESATVDDEGTITVGSDVTVVYPGDTMVNYDDGGVSTLGMYKWTGSAWARTTNLTDLGKAIPDFMGLLAAGITIADATTVTLLIAKYILAQEVDVTGQLSVQSGGRFRAYNGQGVQRRCVQLADDRVDWLDTPDGGDELLVGRIGRLGVGGPIIHDGDHVAPIECEWSATSVIVSSGVFEPAYIQTSDGVVRLAYRKFGSADLCERILSSGVWGSEVVIDSGYECPRYLELPDGTLKLLCSAAGIYEFTWNGSTWDGPVEIISGSVGYLSTIADDAGISRVAYVDSYGEISEMVNNGSSWGAPVKINAYGCDFPAYAAGSSGTVRIAYRRDSDGYICEKVLSGGSWGAENTIVSGSSTHPSYIRLISGDYRIAYRKMSTGYLFEKVYSAGSWGAESTLYASSVDQSFYVQLFDGQLRIAFRRSSDGYLCERTITSYAQIGAGIVDRGSNANGWYVKFGDGTMVQGWGSPLLTASNLSGSIYFVNTGFTFPVTFTALRIVTPKATTIGATVWAGACFSEGVSGFYCSMLSGSLNGQGYIGYVAWGTWK